MHRALDQLNINLDRVNFLLGTYAALEAQTTAAVDLSDLLRAAIVQSVSSADHFIHELLRLGALEIHGGVRPSTPDYHSLMIEVGTRLNANPATVPSTDIDSAIRERNSWRTFQQPQKIADALACITTVPVWAQVAHHMNGAETDIRIRMQLIVDRRNKIAHEADMDPSFPGTRWPITQTMAQDTCDWIRTMCDTIFTVVV